MSRKWNFLGGNLFPKHKDRYKYFFENYFHISTENTYINAALKWLIYNERFAGSSYQLNWYYSNVWESGSHLAHRGPSTRVIKFKYGLYTDDMYNDTIKVCTEVLVFFEHAHPPPHPSTSLWIHLMQVNLFPSNPVARCLKVGKVLFPFVWMWMLSFYVG